MKRNHKLVIITVSLLAISGTLSAQSPSMEGFSADCIKYMSYYQEDYKAKKYDDALANWRKAYKACPANASQNMYIHGTSMYTKLYKKTSDPKAREALADTILAIQNKRLKAYPKKKTDILNNKGSYIINYKGSDARYLNESLRDIVSELKEESSNNILVNLFNSSMKLYGNGEVGKDDVVDTYSLVSGYLDDKKPKDDSERASLEQAKGAVSSLFASSGLASCDVLVEAFTPRFEAEPENATLCAGIVRMMNSVEGCSSNELYFRAVQNYHRLEPSYKSAYALYRMNAARDNVEDAVAYLESAINDEESDELTDARMLYELSVYAYKNKLRSKSADAAKKAVEMDNGYAAQSYIILGNLWSGAYADTEIERFARSWVAADYFQKAKVEAMEEGCAADEGTAAEASKLYASAAKYFPDASEVFMYDLSAGQSYSISLGGMSAKTTVKVHR